jgi:hypothetical protein
MAETKTKPTGKSVESFLEGIDDERRRKDAGLFLDLMARVTGEPPKMWGDSIIGFGKYHYRYESGYEGDAALAGFSPRKNEFSIYLATYFPGMEGKRQKLLDRLGKHRMGKACLYVKRAGDIDLKVLEQLVAMGVEELRNRYPT